MMSPRKKQVAGHTYHDAAATGQRAPSPAMTDPRTEVEKIDRARAMRRAFIGS
jgi:hypothetical protein